MGFSQAQALVGSSFIPDTAEPRIVEIGEAVRIAEAKKEPNGLYEAILLAVSFIFLLLGLLPSQPEQPSGARVPGEEERRAASF